VAWFFLFFFTLFPFSLWKTRVAREKIYGRDQMAVAMDLSPWTGCPKSPDVATLESGHEHRLPAGKWGVRRRAATQTPILPFHSVG
jgi:hypothetical protein